MINSAHRSSGASTSHPLRCSPPLVRTRRKLYNSLCQFSAFVVVLRGIPIELVNLQDSPSIYVRVTRHRMGAVIPSKYVCPAYFIVPVDVPLPNLELIPRACSHLIDLDGVPHHQSSSLVHHGTHQFTITLPGTPVLGFFAGSL